MLESVRGGERGRGKENGTIRPLLGWHRPVLMLVGVMSITENQGTMIDGPSVPWMVSQFLSIIEQRGEDP